MIIQRVILLFITMASIGIVSEARTIYVDHLIDPPECRTYDQVNRTSVGGTSRCFRHLQPAVDFAEYGDTILIREGFYTEAVVIDMDSEKGGLLLISNFRNEQVSIDGNNPGLGPLIVINSDRVSISGLKIGHSQSFGIISRSTRNIRIQNCEVSYSSDGGIVFVDASDITVNGCRVHHNNYRGLEAAHEAISMHNVHGFEVAFCEVFDNKEEGIDGKYGSKDGRIHHNRVYRNNGPNIYIDKANQIDVFNNVIHDAVSKAGISLNIESSWHTEGLAWTLQHVHVYNNLIYNNSGGIGFWLEDSGGPELQSRWDDIHIYNNTIIDNARKGEERGGGIYIINLNPWNFGENISIRNNIFSGNVNEISKTLWNRRKNGLLEKVTIDHNLFIAEEESDTFGESPLMVEIVGFRNPKYHDFSLTPRSEAIDAANVVEFPPFDLMDHSRPFGKAPDMGAFECSEK